MMAEPARRGAGKIIVRAQNRLLLVDQKDVCYASIEGGTISVATPTLEGTSNCRTLEELMEQLDGVSFWRGAPVLRRQYRAHPRSGAVVQVQLSAKNG